MTFKIIDGDFPKQQAIFWRKKGLIPYDALSVVETNKERTYYNARSAIVGIEKIAGNAAESTAKLKLSNGKIIIARIDNPTLEHLLVLQSLGPVPHEPVIIPFEKKPKKNNLVGTIAVIIIFTVIGIMLLSPDTAPNNASSAPSSDIYRIILLKKTPACYSEAAFDKMNEYVARNEPALFKRMFSQGLCTLLPSGTQLVKEDPGLLTSVVHIENQQTSLWIATEDLN